MADLPRYHEKTEFRIEAPSGQLTKFRIRYKSPDTDGKWKTLKAPEIITANQLFLSGAVSTGHTKEKLKIVLAQQYALRDRTKKKPAFMSENVRLVERLWEERYTRRRLRRMKRPEKSKQDLMRAVEAAGPFPLDTCNLEDLADRLDEKFGAFPRKQARLITWLNSILGWLGRPPLDQIDIRERPRVRYLTEPEFLRVIMWHVNDEIVRRLFRIAFYTGLRFGEIFFLKRKHVRAGFLLVEGQLSEKRDEQGNFKDDTTKTNSERDAFLPDIVRDDIEKWVDMPISERDAYRTKRYSDIMRDACIATLGSSEPLKLLTGRDIRHCNAIWLLQLGATLYEVAQHLGNHYEVTERFYGGFVLKKESLERLQGLMRVKAE